MSFEWSRSETVALAKQSCTQCQGFGLRSQSSRKGPVMPCNCVLREIFRICYVRFRQCVSKEKHVSHVRFEIIGGSERRAMWGRKDEEYVADFCLVSRRALTEKEHKLFRMHFLMGADWRMCCRQLGIDRGTFFHSVYRIEQKLGRAFRELKPYALYPLREYFGPVVRAALPRRALVELPKRRKRRAVKPPVKKAA